MTPNRVISMQFSLQVIRELFYVLQVHNGILVNNTEKQEKKQTFCNCLVTDFFDMHVVCATRNYKKSPFFLLSCMMPAYKIPN